MPVELTQLLLAVLLAFAHFAIFAVVANMDLGPAYTAGPRDKPPKNLSKIGGRLQRAYQNYLETLPWFAIAMIAAHLGGKVNDTILLCGWVYLAARVAYVPAYVIAFPFVRSLVWMVATGAIAAIAVLALIG